MQKFLDRCIVEEGDPEDENYKVNPDFLRNSWLFKSLKTLKIVKWFLDQSNFPRRIDRSGPLSNFVQGLFYKKTRFAPELSTNWKENWN